MFLSKTKLIWHSSRTIDALILSAKLFLIFFFSPQEWPKVLEMMIYLTLRCFALIFLRCLGKEVSVNDQRFRGDGVKFKCKVGTSINFPHFL